MTNAEVTRGRDLTRQWARREDLCGRPGFASLALAGSAASYPYSTWRGKSESKRRPLDSKTAGRATPTRSIVMRQSSCVRMASYVDVDLQEKAHGR
jgi:hypothetical protein